MLGWWYSRGWVWLIKDTKNGLDYIGSTFAVRVLLKTWFSPWKQITSPATFRTFFQSAIDNSISRIVGGIVRTAMLSIALIFAIGVIGVGIIRFIFWPFIPLMIVLFPILFVVGGVK